MASQSPAKSSSARPSVPRIASESKPKPQASQPTVSDDSDPLKVPKRAHTFANDTAAENPYTLGPHASGGPDAFDTGDHSDTDDALEASRASVELDILPIELITLIDR
jgi:hypothetical protein